MSADLSTRYLGLQLKNPVIMAASPLTAEILQIERFADAGVSAAVLTSVFEEHIDETSPRECDDAVSPGWDLAESAALPPGQTPICAK